ncbi:hypothetical protein [Priestia megaterium]|uniref:hypothetical protein n=1 Tax=Priestia megaterium TaxID=1404 RepID=UPI002E235FE7|nr:hypothetical protein [Priestia megaterium]MED4102199.1 hypothetical protein [Priestia megaterium]MED4142626.1 hypothetical protein [Priestia megaterium]
MAESKNTESTETKKSTASKIQVVGPVETNSGSTILRFERDAESKPAIDLIPGQVLTVGGNGGDVTKAEAERLLSYSRWEIKEVNE